MKEKTKSYLGDFMLLSVAIMWGFGFIAVQKGLETGMSPFNLMVLRFSIAALALLPFQIKKLKTISISTWKRGALLGFLLFLGFTFQTYGQLYTTTSKVAFLTGVNVVVVPFLTWFITKKRVDSYSLVAAFICLIGIGLLTLNGSLSINVGDGLILVCAVLFAAHITTTSIVTKNESAMTLVFIQMITAAFFSLIFALIYHEPIVVNVSSILVILYLGLFSTMLAFFLQTMGQRYSNATKAAIILSTESLFGALLAVIFLHELFTRQILLGCILIFFAIILSETKLSFLRKSSMNQDGLEENNIEIYEKDIS